MNPLSLSLAADATGPLAAEHPYGAVGFLLNLAVILGVAAVTTVLFQKLRQPVVLGYLLAGLIVGPYIPVPVRADVGVAHTLSEIGVILLMFSLGLEFSLRKVVRAAGTAGIVAAIECSVMVWLGYQTGRVFGWSKYESLFAGAMVAISSTTIIVRAFGERKVSGKIRQIVFGILIVEDLIAILLLAVLTAIASGAGLSASGVAITIGRLMGFLVVLIVVGLLVVPRLVRLVVKLERNETLLVTCVGICFTFALLAHRFGYSVALGAFLAGTLVAESGEARRIEHLIEPVRDMFAAIFFVSVGMIIQPQLLANHWPAMVALTVVIVTGKIVAVSLASVLAGNGVRMSVQAGMSLAQIGEFSFIIAGVGHALGVAGDFLYPLAVGVSALTTLLTPWLIGGSARAAAFVDAHLPHRVQTYASLYESWVERLRSTAPHHATAWSRIRRALWLLVVDVTALAAVIIGASLGTGIMVGAAGKVGLSPTLSRVLIVVAAVALSVPFVLGAVRVTRSLGFLLVREALPAQANGLNLASAPRRALLVTIQLGILLLAGTPLLAITQPLLPSMPVALVLGILGTVLAVMFWRRANDLEEHVRAGAEVVLETLSAQSHSEKTGQTSIARLRGLVPSLGHPKAVRLPDDARAAGRSLRDLNVRGQTGATVLCIERHGRDAILPTGSEVLEAGDIVVLAGSEEAVSNATTLLTRKPTGRTGTFTVTRPESPAEPGPGGPAAP
jgi:CPA2 family monovalent cation:H+ antiporter-2